MVLVTIVKRGRIQGKMDIIAAINEGKKHIQQIDEIRKVDKANNHKLYNDLKGKLIAFTPSCVCKGETLKKENVMKINNIIAIDIDADDNPTLSVEQMRNCKKVTLCSLLLFISGRQRYLLPCSF